MEQPLQNEEDGGSECYFDQQIKQLDQLLLVESGPPDDHDHDDTSQ